jgi:HEAT repeat protein
VARTLRRDPSLDVRRRAAVTLGRIGLSSAVSELLVAAHPAQPAVLRADAVRALGELGAARAVAELVSLVDDGEYAVAHQAAVALVRLGERGLDELRMVVAAERPGAAHAAEALALAALTAAPTGGLTVVRG